ncbi:MAG: DUF885 domain-containing protein [Pirellulales bacterium]|nr:DUF885 domain-containing protein [Pirellulales bacterium]
MHYPQWNGRLSPLLVFSLLIVSPGLFAAENVAERFEALLDEMWESRMQENPLFATSTGDHRFNDRLAEVSLADSARRNQIDRVYLDRLNNLDPEMLPAEDRIHYAIARRLLKEKLAEYKFQAFLIPITHRDGFHLDFPELAKKVPLITVKDFENYAARLNGFERYVLGHMELMRKGLTTGHTLSELVLEDWEEAIEAQIVEKPEQSLLYEPCQNFPTTVAESEHRRLQTAVRDAISNSVVPGYRKFRHFMESEYVPQARGSIGASAFPGGRDFYRHRVRKFTTLDLTPEEVHNIGLAEVKRIRAEMDEIIKRVEFEGEFAAFIQYLREDPQFYATSEEELLKEVAYVLKQMDGKLPELFGHLPRMPYGLLEIPDYVAPRTTSAYYQRASGDGTRAGFYYMNTYNLKSRPLYTVEALSFHEAVPGHHLQLALQQEIEDLPHFRRFSSFTAYVEGWALYAERLGLEAGFYQDPYSDFGRLTMEIWRACRLVVDTGIHYFGWTRERAIEYLRDNSSLSLHNIRAEVDRYISWPGQALGYKIGEMKIRALRAHAEEQLGNRFNVRSFHDAVLITGSVPLDVLEANVNAWIQRQIHSAP